MKLGFTIQVDTARHRIPRCRKGRARGRAPRLHRVGEHQPGQSADCQEEPERDHRIPADAADVAYAGAITYAGYIIGFPGDTEGIRYITSIFKA